MSKGWLGYCRSVSQCCMWSNDMGQIRMPADKKCVCGAAGKSQIGNRQGSRTRHSWSSSRIGCKAQLVEYFPIGETCRLDRGTNCGCERSRLIRRMQDLSRQKITNADIGVVAGEPRERQA